MDWNQLQSQESRTLGVLYEFRLNLVRDLHGPEPTPKPGIQDSRISGCDNGFNGPFWSRIYRKKAKPRKR